MNFEMQDLVGSWCILEDGRLGKIDEIYMRNGVGDSKIWKPRYPVRLSILSNTLGGNCHWFSTHKTHYLDQLNIITPEVAEIYMQANNLTPPERKRNERL